MASIGIGKKAEASVAEFLKRQGYVVLEQNWRTRWCEIDLVVQKDEIIYFIEVKYRTGNAQGRGFDYIGPQKSKRLLFAAEIWTAASGWEGDYRIVAAEVSGIDFQTIELAEVY